MSDKLKVGIIGTGIIGKSHVRNYQSMQNDVEIVAVADIDESEAQRVAQEYDIPHVFSDYRDLLKIDEIDSVDVCLPNFLHAPVTIAALEAGKHVYCEKPMAKTGPEAVAMYEAAQQTGKKLSVQMATVFAKETQIAKYLIKANALGNVYYVKTSHYRRRGRPYVDGYATPHFVQKEKAGGGTLLDTAIYNMARMVYLLDNPEIETVTASTFQELDMDEGTSEKTAATMSKNLAPALSVSKVGLPCLSKRRGQPTWTAVKGDRIMGSKGGLKLNPFTFYTDLYDMDADVTFDIDGYERRMRSLGQMGDGYDKLTAACCLGLVGAR